MKSFWVFALIALTACSPATEDMSTPETPPSEYFMTYKVDGKKITLGYAVLKTFENDVRYFIEGSSTTQGDVNVVRIQHDDGPPREGTFVTNEANLMFILGLEGGTSSTFTMLPPSFGAGEFTISEITDTYAKGSFHFTAIDSDEGSKRNFIITDGRFKAKRIGY